MREQLVNHTRDAAELEAEMLFEILSSQSTSEFRWTAEGLSDPLLSQLVRCLRESLRIVGRSR